MVSSMTAADRSYSGLKNGGSVFFTDNEYFLLVSLLNESLYAISMQVSLYPEKENFFLDV